MSASNPTAYIPGMQIPDDEPAEPIDKPMKAAPDDGAEIYDGMFEDEPMQFDEKEAKKRKLRYDVQIDPKDMIATIPAELTIGREMYFYQRDAKEKKKKRNGGTPIQFTPNDRKMAATLAGFGLPQRQIACVIAGGISEPTLVKYFSEEIEEGRARANAIVAQTLFQKVMAGDTTAMIWWTKTQMGWHDTRRHEITGANGDPLQAMQVNIKSLTGDELTAMKKLLGEKIIEGVTLENDGDDSTQQSIQDDL